MIRRLVLKNFQGHVYSDIEFSPGFNLILGPSDNGKSSIIRAIEWVRKNRPRGSDFINYKSDSAEVVIYLDNTIYISRERGTNDTGKYYVYERGEVGDAPQEYSFTGGEVPEAVSELLNLDDLNVQMQLDSHYLILDSPGKAATELNALTKLDKLTNALAKLKEEKTRIYRVISSKSSDLSVLGKKVDSGVKERVSELKEVYQKLVKLESVIDSDREIIAMVSSLVVSINEMESMLKRAGSDVELFSDKVETIVKMVNKNKSEIKRYNESITLINKISDLQVEIKNTTNDIKNIESEMAEISKGLEECPYCGNELDTKSRNKLLGE